MGRDKVESEYVASRTVRMLCAYWHDPDEDLIKYAWPQDVWFHVDKLSSAHVYLRLPESISSWEAIPEALLVDCAQLVKANSIEGTKVPSRCSLSFQVAQAINEMTLRSSIPQATTSRYALYPRCMSNPEKNRAKKTGDMAVGQVSFHNDKRVRHDGSHRIIQPY